MKNYIFIDGGYLDKVLERFGQEIFDCTPLNISYEKVRGSHSRGFYYDCPIKIKSGQDDEGFQEAQSLQNTKFSKIEGTQGMHLFTGILKGSRQKLRQKGIDVKIAVDMFTHAIRENMDRATLLAGDLDFYPIVDALVRNGVYVTLLCEKA